MPCKLARGVYPAACGKTPASASAHARGHTRQARQEGSGAAWATCPRLHLMLHRDIGGVILLELFQLVPAHAVVHLFLVNAAHHLGMDHAEVELIWVLEGCLIAHAVDRILRARRQGSGSEWQWGP
eukprot:scaffold285502_cov26-Tisochrysis_lutea.AAC.2